MRSILAGLILALAHGYGNVDYGLSSGGQVTDLASDAPFHLAAGPLAGRRRAEESNRRQLVPYDNARGRCRAVVDDANFIG